MYERCSKPKQEAQTRDESHEDEEDRDISENLKVSLFISSEKAMDAGDTRRPLSNPATEGSPISC